MSLILDDLYSEIADAIREKDPMGGGIKASDFADRVNALRTKNNISSYPIVVNSVRGATITATRGDVTISSVVDASGTTVLWVPTAGTWNVVASKGSYTSPAKEVEINGDASLLLPGINRLRKVVRIYPNTTDEVGAGSCSADTYAWFAGGFAGDGSKNLYGMQVCAIDADLVVHDCDPMSRSRQRFQAVAIHDTVIFAMGWGSSKTEDSTDAYDGNLTKIDIPGADQSAYHTGGGTVGEKAFIGGGQVTNYPELGNIVNAYDDKLTKTIPAKLSSARFQIGSLTVGDRVLFAGGQYSSNNSSVPSSNYNTVDTYTENEVHSTTTALSAARGSIGAAMAGNNGIFVGGFAFVSFQYFSNAESYDSNLSRKNAPNLMTSSAWMKGTSLGDVAIFSSGKDSNDQMIDRVEVYDENLVHSLANDTLPEPGYQLSGAHIGDYALFNQIRSDELTVFVYTT